MAFCTGCGSQLDESLQFCVKCGRPVASEVPLTQSFQTPPVAAAPLPAPILPPIPSPVPSFPTPVPTAVVGSQYAGFWLRFVANLIDSAILGIPFAAIMSIGFFAFGGVALIRGIRGLKVGPDGSVDPSNLAGMIGSLIPIYATAILGVIVLSWLYYASMESSARQATLGKAAMSLRVTDGNGARMSFGHASGRYFSKIVTGIVPFGIGWIMAGFTAKKQALHDMIAGTLVYRDS